ncbi:hypothetical protein C7I55_06575 [Sphingomonas deserti]|uniref:Uncharacterized protein n=1 Tax=Allosphingosinicella deserti TaxID=2116704 RepID=A0A2P7QVE5_9SPHN|nr:hypothetical protein C7I55_06575 [Sphingomonas deserti]
MAPCAIEDLLHGLRADACISRVDGNKYPAVIDASLVVGSVFVAHAMFLEKSAQAAGKGANSCTDRSCFGDGRCSDRASSRQRTNSWDRERSDAEECTDTSASESALEKAFTLLLHLMRVRSTVVARCSFMTGNYRKCTVAYAGGPQFSNCPFGLGLGIEDDGNEVVHISSILSDRA